MSIEQIKTPIDWLRYITRIPTDQAGKKLARATRKATGGLSIVGSIALIGLTGFGQYHVSICQVEKAAGHCISTATMMRLVELGLVDFIMGKKGKEWTLTPTGRDHATAIQSALQTLIAKAIK
jgi:hypothetical protein